MKNLFIFLILTTITLFSEDKVIAFVNNKPVLESEVKDRMKEENMDFKEALNKIIDEKLLLCESENLQIKVSEEEITKELERIKKRFPDEQNFLQQLEKENISLYDFKKMIEERIKINKLIFEKVTKNIFITTSELADFYEKEKGEQEIKYYLKGLSFANKEEAENFYQSWNNEKENIMDDLGWIKKSELLPTLAKEIEEIKEGEITKPVIVKTKYHIFLVKKIKRENILDDTTMDVVRNRIFQKKYSDKMKKLLEELRSKYPVKIYQDVSPTQHLETQ